MSLIYAEGFEHFHPNAKGLSTPNGGLLSPKYSMFAYSTSHSSYDIANTSGTGGFWNTSYTQAYNEALHKPYAYGRKNGKALLLSPTTGTPYKGTYGGLLFYTPKSRTIYTGFAFKIPSGVLSNVQVVVVFYRNVLRRNMQDADVAISLMPVGGMAWQERGGYADIAWHFQGQPSTYRQLTHNKNLLNGDWHFMEVGTTVYGNTPGDPTAWGECRFGGVSDIASNITTATPNTENESFLSAVSIRISGVRDLVFDDIYACNDEGFVNNTFLGGIFVRPMNPSATGPLMDSVSVGAVYRHDAVGPHYVGDETKLPVPLPTHEEDPTFVQWGNPKESHLIIPREGNRQNFYCTDVDFAGSSPRIHGVTADIIADSEVARSVFTPIKTIGGSVHTYFPAAADMTPYRQAGLRTLIYENPNAYGVIDEADPQWSAQAVNDSDYGFRVDAVVEQGEYEKRWNPAWLRYPVLHENFLEEELGLSEFVSRHWEELIEEGFDTEDDSRWDWACPVYEELTLFDEIIRVRVSYCGAWSNIRLEDAVVFPAEYIRDGMDFDDSIQMDSVNLIEDELGAADTSYHEFVEELRVWLDPYDAVQRDWVVSAYDELAIDITDIFDNHFDAEDDFEIAPQIRSNHLLIEETLYANVWTQQGIGIDVEDGFDIEEDHFDGNWVEQFEEWIGAGSDILTRHWRFEMFWFVCVGWWNIGVVEQPLEWDERNPCDVKNDNLLEAYKSFFGHGGYYDEVMEMFKEQWLHLGGDPYLDFSNVRWADFYAIVFDGLGNAVDMVDADGNSIIEVT